MACVGTFIEVVGHGGVRCGSLNRYAVGKLPGGSGCEGDDRLGLVMEGNLSCPAVINNFYLPKAILGVSSQDSLAMECDFATCFVKNYFTACIAQDGNREEIVDKARELMCWACIRPCFPEQ